VPPRVPAEADGKLVYSRPLREFASSSNSGTTTGIIGDWDTTVDAIGYAGGKEPNYDWATFISAYASGRWDPLRTPNPPRPSLISSTSDLSTSTGSSLMSSPSSPSSYTSAATSEPSHSQSFTHLSRIGEVGSEKFLDGFPTKSSSSIVKSQVVAPTNIYPSHRLRASLADLRSQRAPVSSSNPEVVTAAATMRWAAARVNLAPLALPSPEHELTDPMRDYTTSIPGTHFPDSNRNSKEVTSNSLRRSQLASFWEGTQDVDVRSRLSTIEGSPLLAPSDSPPLTFNAQFLLPLPASAPTERAPDIPPGDYFGDAEKAQESNNEAQRALVQVAEPHAEMRVLSVPVPPRTAILTRQTSSPLPITTPRESVPPGGRSKRESTNVLKAGRAAKEEQVFAELGYLPPPNPPDESERRRALYK